MRDSVIRIAGLYIHYETAAGEVPVLKDFNLTIEPGEFVAIMGPSGSGKSTFMNILGCLVSASAGTYFLNGEDVGTLNKDQLARLRNQVIGFVFLGFFLLLWVFLFVFVALLLVFFGANNHARMTRA